MLKSRWTRRVVGALGVSGLLYLALGWFRAQNLGSVQRGARVAERAGCFTCHGPGGTHGMPDPGHGLGDVPDWTGGLITMYAENEGEIREWIEDGMPRRIRSNPGEMKQRQKAVVLMPAFRGLLSEAELEDLVSYVKAVTDITPPKDERAVAGRDVALKFGCFHCHGPQGRGSLPNPRSLKGYIPGWDGADFPELARDDGEVRDWILEGGTKRLLGNPIARFFLEREPVKMPAYRDQITPAEVEEILDYIHWLRQHP